MTDYSPLELVLPDIDNLTNGELRILTRETGAALRQIQTLGRLIGALADTTDPDEIADLEHQIVATGVDEADLVYGLGRVALRRTGIEDTPENADRVVLISANGDTPKDAT